MSRLKVLVTQPRMALGALFTVALATAAVVGSGADFTARSANPANEFTTGTLDIASSSTGAIISAGNLRPGAPARTGTVDIRNTGSLSGKFALQLANLKDAGSTKPLSSQLTLTVRDCGAFAAPDGPAPDCGDELPVFSGKLDQFGGAAKTLSTFASDEKHRYQIELQLPNTADDAYQGGSATFDLSWLATS